MNPSDASLIARVIASDDRHAFATLVRRHQDAVRRLLRRLTAGNHALADDLAQETFIRAYKGIGSFAGKAQLASWLYRIAYNCFLSEIAKAKPQAPLDEGLPAESHTSEPFLEKAMASLRPEERMALALFYGQGFTPEEIAVVLDCPEGTVKTHLHRGRENLRAALEVSHG